MVFGKKITVLRTVYCYYCGSMVKTGLLQMRESRFKKLLSSDRTNNKYVENNTSHDATSDVDNGTCSECKNNNLRSEIFI